MSLPLLVIVVWFWRLVHVTICALLGSPEASSLATIHDIHALTQVHGKALIVEYLIHQRPLDCALNSACALSTASMLNIHPPLFFSCHAVHRLHSRHLAHGFVVVLRGGKELGRARRRPSSGWCIASGEETQHRQWENVEMSSWHRACWARPTLHCV